MYKILIIDDSPDMFEKVEEYNINNRCHYDIKLINSDVDVHGYVSQNPVDLLLTAWILDNNKNGINLIKELKFNRATSNLPIILCTWKDAIQDQVDGLNQGADDFFKKSYPLELLFSKMNAILRKLDKNKNNKANLMRKFYFIDENLEVEHLGQRHKLSNKEYIIFKTLVQNPGRVFSQEELNKMTSGDTVFVSRRCVDTFIAFLRKKLGKDCIVSVRKKGYKLNDNLIELDKDEIKAPQGAFLPVKS